MKPRIPRADGAGRTVSAEMPDTRPERTLSVLERAAPAALLESEA